MAGVPPPRDDDIEDVAWALQTADALWKRNERVDAIVWVRRAAQAAGDAENDDRAFALARNAADLAEWVEKNPASTRSSRTAPSVSPAVAAPATVRDSRRPVTIEEIPEIDTIEEINEVEEVVEDTLTELSSEVRMQIARSAADLANAARQIADDRDEPTIAEAVPTAAQLHAGLLDPWAQAAGSTIEARPPAAADSRRPPTEPSAPAPTAPSAPASVRPSSRAPTAQAAPASSTPSTPVSTAAPVTPSPKLPVTALDLSAVAALADLPDDVRGAFAGRAKIEALERGDEVSGFALALIVEGSVDVMSALIDAPALTLEAGEMLRGRGTVERVVPLRLVARSNAVRAATWGEAEVVEAFGSCPWVEDELRSASDKAHALVGVTLGPLGERLDASIRADITTKLRLRTLARHEVVVKAGEPTPGLLVVGAGELETLGDNGEPLGPSLRAGDFLFPREVLSASAAPKTVRAADCGALVLASDRGVAQELLVTYPPLLEMFAEGS